MPESRANKPDGAVLPQVRGRAPRVASLVYNDAHADSRVLKSVATLRAAGAEVTIFAVARARSGFPAGCEVLPSGVRIVRVPEFDLGASAPAVAWVYRRALAGMGRLMGLARKGASKPQTRESGVAKASAPEGASTPEARAAVGRVALGKWAMKPYRAVSLALYWHRAARAALAWAPDVVHANDGNTLAPAMRIAKRTGAAIVYDAHELWRHRNVERRLIAHHVEHLIERVGIRRASAVITVSPSIAAWLQREYRLPRTPVLVRNIPAAGEAPDPGTGRLRELAGLPAEAKVIAYGGRITTNRGIEETLAALTLMSPDVHLVLLGYGEADYVEPLRERARAAGLGARVHLVGKVASDEVSQALADADLAVVYVRPTCLSYRFSLPNKLFESIHGGLPIAAANLPDTRQVVEQYEVGRIFATDRPEDLAATMTEVLSDPEAYRAAARAAARELTWESEAERLVEQYTDVLGGRR